MKPANAYRGEVQLEVGGTTYELRFDYDALARLTEHFGTDFAAKIIKAQLETDLRTLCMVLEIGLVDGPSADEIFALSPPLGLVSTAIERAFLVAYEGPEGLQEVAHPNPLLNRLMKMVSRGTA